MKIRLYFKQIIPPTATVDRPVALTREQHHYLHRVLRLKPGREVFLFNAIEGEWRGHLGQLSPKSGYLEGLSQVRPGLPTEHRRDIILYFTPIKRARLGTIFAMGSELGVTEFRPIYSRFGNSSLPKLERVEAQLVEATEQCGRLDVPRVTPMRTFATMLEDISAAHLPSFAALERGAEQTLSAALANGLSSLRHADSVAFIVGPEGGWHDAEIAALQQHAQGISLGRRILRSETAVAAVLAQYQGALDYAVDIPAESA